MLFVFIVDLEADLNGLRKWLHEVESQVLPLHVKSNWTVDELEQKLREHQVSFYIFPIKKARPWHQKISKALKLKKLKENAYCKLPKKYHWLDKKVTGKRQQVFTS